MCTCVRAKTVSETQGARARTRKTTETSLARRRNVAYDEVRVRRADGRTRDEWWRFVRGEGGRVCAGARPPSVRIFAYKMLRTFSTARPLRTTTCLAERERAIYPPPTLFCGPRATKRNCPTPAPPPPKTVPVAAGFLLLFFFTFFPSPFYFSLLSSSSTPSPLPRLNNTAPTTPYPIVPLSLDNTVTSPLLQPARSIDVLVARGRTGEHGRNVLSDSRTRRRTRTCRRNNPKIVWPRGPS